MSVTAGALQRLGVALADLVALDIAALSDVEALDALRALHPLLCQTEALQTQLIGAVHRRGSATLDGSVSTLSWLRCRLRLGDAGTQIRVAKALQGLPHVAEAYGRGEMSFAHAAAITEVPSDIEPGLLAAGADKLLAEQAAALGQAAHPPGVRGSVAGGGSHRPRLRLHSGCVGPGGWGAGPEHAGRVDATAHTGRHPVARGAPRGRTGADVPAGWRRHT
jgi:hypothetical protein